MVKLQWLQVNKFRSVKQGTRLTFNAGHNVLLGQNGTGKTTLLNLIAAAVKSDFTEFKDEDFDLLYTLASAKAEMIVSVRNESQSLATTAELTSNSPLHADALAAMSALKSSITSFTADMVIKSSRTRFEFDVSGKSGSVRSANETGLKLPPEVFGPKLWVTMIAGLSLLRPSQDKAVAINPFSEALSLFTEFATCRFDESLAYFNDLNKRQIKVRHAPDGQMTSVGYKNSSDSIKEQVVIKVGQRWGADRYVLTDAELPFLKKAVQFFDFESAEAILELQDSANSEDARVMQLGDLKFYFRHRGGRRVSEKMLSYGQKRMLAFSNYAASAESVIVADELVNGLHHKWIRACFEMVDGKQLFLTSQNPLLLDYLGFQSVDDVLSTFVLCRWDSAAEQMVWENMSQDAAQDFFDSYKVGFQHVGELLQTKGLW